MAKKSLQEWKNKVFGTKIDLDNQSFDCVDVSKSWVEYLTDKPWTVSAGWGNAKDIYFNWSQTYLQQIPRGNAPQLGDILVMNGNIGGGYGHTGVVVGIDGGNITIYQQDTFKQVPVYTGVFGWNTNLVQGFLRPKVAFETGLAPLEGYQRTTVPEGVYYRKEPKRAGEVIELFDGNEIVNFKGYVRGESVDGNNIWFVGRFTGGYSHSSGYTDSSTTGLDDLTPVVVTPPVLAANQRQVASDAMNVRSTAKIAPDNVTQLLQPSAVITLKGYVRGQNVDGVDIWFVLEDGTYTWSAGYTNATVDGLTDLTPKPPVEPTDPVTPTEPSYPANTTDPLVTKVFNKKNPIGMGYAPSDLVNAGNGTQLRKEAAGSLGLMQAAATTVLTPQSGYRSYATQQTLYNNYVAQDGQAKADTYSARPGYSEHQTGLTMDFAPIADSFKSSAAYAWLTANAYKYGWIERYPETKVSVTGYSYEPWHWRYVGVEVATDMHNKNVLTLEEYYNIAGGLYPDQEPTVPVDPTQPTDPTTPPVTPAPTDEATKSAAAFLARVSTQVAAAGVIVSGLVAMVTQYTGLVIEGSIQGIATLVLALGIIGYGQYRYKKSGGTKGWLF